MNEIFFFLNIDSEKSMNSFETRKESVTWLFIGHCFYKFFNNFSTLLLYKINKKIPIYAQFKRNIIPECFGTRWIRI